MRALVAATCVLSLAVGINCKPSESTAPMNQSVATRVIPVLLEHPIVRHKVDRDRKDTPWHRMNDSEFSQAVERAGGFVMIGLKGAGQQEGVDNTGRALATLEELRPVLGTLRALGVQIRREFAKVPAIAAHVSPALAVALRGNPFVDYVEPAYGGRPATQSTPWGVTRVGAAASWGLSTGSGVKLLVLDTGVGLDGKRLECQRPVPLRRNLRRQHL